MNRQELQKIHDEIEKCNIEIETIEKRLVKLRLVEKHTKSIFIFSMLLVVWTGLIGLGFVPQACVLGSSYVIMKVVEKVLRIQKDLRRNND